MASFLVVLAVALHVLIGQRFALTVPDARVVTRSTAAGATVLVPGELEPRHGVSLVRVRTIEPTPAPVPGVDAYVVSTSTRLADGTVVARDRWSGVQERGTGRVVASPFNSELVTVFDAGGNTVEQRRPLRTMGGVLLRFPRDTPEDAQPRWDPMTRSVGFAAPDGASRVGGARVVEMVQQSESTVDGVRTVADSRLSIRPETGAVVREDVDVQRSRTDGTVLIDARFVDDNASVRRASAAVDRQVVDRRLAGTTIPLVVLLVGTLTAAAAVLEGRTGRSSRDRRRVQPEEAR